MVDGYRDECADPARRRILLRERPMENTLTPQDGAASHHPPSGSVAPVIDPPARKAGATTFPKADIAFLPAPRPITPEDLHALLASSDSTAYAADLLGLLQPSARVFDGIPAVVEEVAARDTRLGGTLRALCLEMGWGRAADPNAAWVEYERLAAAGCRVAELFVSSALMNTKDTPSEAVDRLQALLHAGSGQAGLMLGIHWTALGREEEAVAALRRATDLGNAPAAHLFGSRLWKGIGVVKDKEAGLACWLHAANGQNPQAMVDIGVTLENGLAGAPPDPRRAVAWFEAAAAIGYVDASTRAAWALWKLGDADKAAPHAQTSTASGSATGRYLLGLMMRDGRGREQDPAGALAQFEAAARDGVGGAMVAAGRMLLAGQGCSTDPASATEWFRKAAEAGDAVGMREWGHALLAGSGVAKDPQAAMMWLHRAAKGGDASASRALAQMLDEGHARCWDGSPSRAIDAFEMAVAQSTDDDQRAQTAKAMVDSRASDISMAGSRLLDRLASSGVASDLVRAGKAAAATRFPERGAEWLRKAVELGEVEAAHTLAVGIREGRIATRDPEEASRLLRWAASRGYEPSKRTLENRLVHPLAPDARFARLDAMIGLDPVKRKLRDVAYALQLDTVRRSKGYKGGSPAPAHLAFLGNPGTGKTTVAREVGDIYRSIGRLAKGHVIEVKRADLVGRYIGETEANTRAAFDRACDGVLFVDEAYELSMGDSARDFGVKALGVLLTEMENRRDRVVVIVAGYVDQMEGFFDSNPGLPSRIPADNRVVFPDYEPEELLRIFDRTAREEEFRVTKAARDAAWLWCQGAKAAAGKRFGNGRDVRDLLWGGIMQNMGRRLCSPGVQGGDVGLIVSEDVPRLA